MSGARPGVFPEGLLPLQEVSVAEALAGLGRATLCVNDPPWSRIVAGLPAPVRVVQAGDMELARLETLLASEPDGDTVVGIGGGSAIDTAKFIAWKSGKVLVQVPSITSVDAAFTDAIGVRVDGRVRYVGQLLPKHVVLDIPLVQSAPRHMNRAGMGDVLSCHTGLWDWRAAVRAGQGAPWHDAAAALGTSLLAELDAAAEDIKAVSVDGVRWLASAYRRVGAACAQLRHSRFEEGAEHFIAYTYEHLTGRHPLHGELIALCVFVASELQANQADAVRSVIERTGVRAHPEDLGVDEASFVRTLCAARDYARQEALDHSVLDECVIDEARARAAWRSACTLPRVSIASSPAA